ncbi:conserved hypothetical protein [Pirellula staleyi DSM 6068]|uniref:VOC domain-containing protein n=1 Tax=Pirellula staleyi (strain ATCC 27377 / DSM 6068 / ICPB 4128) TaxID=530564 RepID=D2R376_PIRSD|nr:glyoxalase/bleomycin resistance/dioxygenase family protein [Pirellula staleyi]ADB15107.1 conserved hypothetical protein [Pirellula staleyi DSM 6068]
MFKAGRNIAMKVPSHLYEATVAFYRDVIALPTLTANDAAVSFAFGDKQLWIDRVPTLSQAEVWLEVVTDDLVSAEKALENWGIVRCDEIEQLPDGFHGFWIANPASIIHLIAEAKGAS